MECTYMRVCVRALVLWSETVNVWQGSRKYEEGRTVAVFAGRTSEG